MSTLKADTIQNTSGGAATLTKQSAAKAWVTHDSSAVTTDSFGTSSVSDLATGEYGLNFSNTMSNDDYVGSGSNLGATSSYASGFTSDGGAITSSRMDYKIINFSTLNSLDQTFNRAVVHGDLA